MGYVFAQREALVRVGKTAVTHGLNRTAWNSKCGQNPVQIHTSQVVYFEVSACRYSFESAMSLIA